MCSSQVLELLASRPARKRMIVRRRIDAVRDGKQAGTNARSNIIVVALLRGGLTNANDASSMTRHLSRRSFFEKLKKNAQIRRGYEVRETRAAATVASLYFVHCTRCDVDAMLRVTRKNSIRQKKIV